MNKQFLTFAMLASVMANAQVTHVEPVGADYAKPKQYPPLLPAKHSSASRCRDR